MANILTGLIPTVYSALDTVSRELVGFIPAVRRNTGIERAGKGQDIKFPIVPQGAAEDITPGQEPADTGDQTIGVGSLTISKSRAYPIKWNGEEQKSLDAGADVSQYDNILKDQFAQAFRTLTNEIEVDIFNTYVEASRAVGSASSLPFGTANDLSDFAAVVKALNENGAPFGDRHLILGNASAGNVRSKQSSLFKVNESGTNELLRNGVIGTVQGLQIGESGQVVGHTKGTGTGYVTDLGATLPKGSTTITLKTGTGTILAGDVISFAGDSYKYVVKTGTSGPGDITISEPGLRVALADDVALTVGGSPNEVNLAFDRGAIVLGARLPAMVMMNGKAADKALDRMTVTDPVSGLSFEVSVYGQYRQMKIEVAISWGVGVVKPAHVVQLLG